MTSLFTSRNSRVAATALVVIGAVSLSACSTVNSKSKMSSQKIFGNQSLSSAYLSLPKAPVRSSDHCAVQRPARTSYTPTRTSYINEVQCYDGSLVSDASHCGPIHRRQTTLAPIPVPARHSQAPASICSSGYLKEVVYYDYNRSNSTETTDAVSRVMNYGQQCDIRSIQVFGHTDTSGGEVYNTGLSSRRAWDVKNELVRQGLSGVPITAQPMGERENAVERGDGVREPLNRRSVIQVQTRRHY